MRFRQVHLDFHTSEMIPDIGAQFSKQQFQQMLQLGRVNSITVFSKCCHGWAYHPSKANEMHPHLKFDLLGGMIEAAHEIDVRTPVYLSAGLDERLARRHPEWLMRDEDDRTNWVAGFMTPGYHQFCLNTPYLDVLLAQIEEVARNYDADGIFLDIVGVRECYCHTCVADMRKQGLDPRDKQSLVPLWENTYANYTRRVRETVDAVKPGLSVFHNSGHVPRGRRDLAAMSSHLELESLPTGGWGYDHFPLSARYVQSLGMPYLGMTGKFHTNWGEFGGYKHPNALRYEMALSLANGARCSIGDQLHPEGLMDPLTYSLIGAAYREVEAKEAWCAGTGNIADVALLSLEAAGVHKAGMLHEGRTAQSDAGAVRLLLEGKYLFDVIDLEAGFNAYKVLILPDYVRITELLKRKIADFVQQGGKVLATGESGLNPDGTAFALELGVKAAGANPFCPDYFKPHFPVNNFGEASFVFYAKGQRVELDGGQELGHREDPYFNRDVFAFCSHQHTPTSHQYGGPGMVESGSGIYIAWNIFEDYAAKGSLPLKEVFHYALNRLLPEKTLETNLPVQGIVTVQEQAEQRRWINHLLYASPVRRGTDIEVIEDVVPIHDLTVKLRVPGKVRSVYLAPQMAELPFTESDGQLSYTVPKLECHQMVVIETNFG